MIISRSDYKTSMETLFSDRKRFRIIKDDSTPTRFNSVQRYFRKLLQRGEINGTTYETIPPRAAKPARVHRLPKIHKNFDKITKFRHNRYNWNNPLRTRQIPESVTAPVNN